jgi:dihydrofolate reductase
MEVSIITTTDPMGAIDVPFKSPFFNATVKGKKILTGRKTYEEHFNGQDVFFVGKGGLSHPEEIFDYTDDFIVVGGLSLFSWFYNSYKLKGFVTVLYDEQGTLFWHNNLKLKVVKYTDYGKICRIV